MAYSIAAIFLFYLSFCLSIFYLLFVWKNWKFFKFSYKEHAFFIPILPILGNSWLLYFTGNSDNLIEAVGFLARKFGFPFNLWHGHNYHYCTIDPMEAKAILHNSSAQNKGSTYSHMACVFSNSLLIVPYQQWRMRRKQYAKCFKPQSLKSFSGSYYNGSQELVKDLNTNQNEKSYDFFTKYAFSNFVDTSCGFEKPPTGIQRWGECLMKFQEHVAQKLLDPFTPPEIWLKYYPGGKNTAKNVKEIKGIIKKIIEEKSHQRSDFKAFVESESAPPILDLMMSVKGTTLDDESICDDMVLFSEAASDTSGHALTIGFTLLGMHPEVQEKVYNEVIGTVGHTNSITSDDLPTLVYTEAVVNETLRLFPVIPLVSRLLDKDVNIGSKIIPKGSNAAVSIYHMHRDEKYWPDPLKFDPDRFLPENASKIIPFSYIAFSTGPRDCIAKAQAMAMLKISFASVVRNFKITSKHKSVAELKCTSSITLKTIDKPDCHFAAR